MVNCSANFPLPSMITVTVLSHNGHLQKASTMVNRSHRLRFNTPEAEYHTISLAPLFPNAGRFLRPRDRRNASGLLHKLFGEIFGEVRRKKRATVKMEDDRWEVFPLQNYCYNKAHTRGTIGDIIKTRHLYFFVSFFLGYGTTIYLFY